MSANHAIDRRTILAIVLGIACLGSAADLVTKDWVFRTLGPPPSPVWWLWPEFVGFETSVNTGALFGLGQGYVSIFAIVSIMALLAILAWLILGPRIQEYWFAAILGLILAGIVGNLYDRLGLWGTAGVRDWILLKYGQLVWPNFNLADSFLVCGAILMAFRAFWVADPGLNGQAVTKVAGQ